MTAEEQKRYLKISAKIGISRSHGESRLTVGTIPSKIRTVLKKEGFKVEYVRFAGYYEITWN